MKDNKIAPIGETHLNFLQTVGDSIMFSNWCIKKHKSNKGATYIYKGNSLCSECFKKAKK